MPKNMKVYDLLISCPSDVQEYISIIEECIENFNRNYGQINNTLISTKFWKNNSFPESGDKAQALLNKQFVLDSDVAVALFWTKFGTPTDDYGSGTEEEIEELLKQDKQVFMYFLNAPISPDKLDSGQYQKIKEFQDRYKDRGIYDIINDKEEFQRQFTNHLALYFMPLISGDSINSTHKSNMRIEDSFLSKQVTRAQKTHLVDTEFIKRLSEKCKRQIIDIKNIIIPENKVAEEIPIATEVQKFGKINTINMDDRREKVIINDNWKNLISELSASYGLVIDEYFFDVGSLTKTKSIQYQMLGGAIGGAKYYYEGSTIEKEKYKAIKALYLDVIRLQDCKKYFSEIDNFSFVTLGVLNDGQTFDEDIDITLYFEKNMIVVPSSFPVPGESIIEEVDNKMIDFLFYIDSNEKTIRYDNYPTSVPDYTLPSIGMVQYKKSYDEFKTNYINEIEEMMCYKIFEKTDVDILQFKVKYLKQHTKMLFPSRLYLKNIDSPIKYEILSKYSPEILKGEIDVKE